MNITPPRLKANEKLPRGSFFYIQVEDRFYAGEEAESREVEIKDTPSLNYYAKNGDRLNSRQRRWFSQDGWGWSGRSTRSYQTRHRRDVRKDSVPAYRKPLPKTEPEFRKEFTGKLSPKFVDEVKDAKKYRRQDLVDSACERLKAMYGGLDAKVSVRYQRGEEQ